jgi:hypothetical protein
MRTDISSSLSLLARRRVARLGLPTALAFAALGGGCAEDPPAQVAAETLPDAGPACEQGTRGCSCPCRAELLCIAGRCLQTEGPREPAPEPAPRPRPAPPPPPPPLFDAGAEPAASDAGPTTGDEPDAEAPDASS